MEPAKQSLEDFKEGDSISFEMNVTDDDVDQFAKVSGDFSPLHMDDAFARERGFTRRVVHGALVGGYVSQVLGMRFPGENCVLQTLDLQFAAPAYPGDTLAFRLVVDQVSPATGTMVVKVRIETLATSIVVVRAKARVGFSNR